MYSLLKSSVVGADKAGAAVVCRWSVSTAERPAVVRSSRARAERRPAGSHRLVTGADRVIFFV